MTVDPRAMTPAELAAAQVHPLELVHRPDLLPLAPFNHYATGGPEEVVEAVVDVVAPIPGLVTGDEPPLADLGSGIASSIASTVLGPISELAIQAVLTAVAGGLIVWAVIALARKSETVQTVGKAGAAVATKGAL